MNAGARRRLQAQARHILLYRASWPDLAPVAQRWRSRSVVDSAVDSHRSPGV